jgi:hypothetical protein
MAYQINKTDGTIVATVADGQVDDLSTDLTLIGKNYSGYGESFNENFVKLLENFSNTAEPTHPIRGQIWFDASELKLKVYTGTAFVPVSSATISNTQPATLGVGDLWFNEIDRQLYFFDGDDTILLGPAYSENQGLSGLKVDSILDNLNQTRVVTYLYNNGILLGIFSKDAFTPKVAIEGYSGDIIPGFNAGTLAGIKFDVTCTNSEQLGAIPAATYVRKDTSNQIDGQIRITTDLGLVIGSGGNGTFTVTTGDVFLSNLASDRSIIMSVRRDIAQETAMQISGAARTINFYEGYTDSSATFGGSLTVEGDLTVNGEQTVVNTETLTVEDKNIQLARQEGVIPTDSNASGGGIILDGATPHVLLWSELGDAASGDLPALAASAWTSSENFNLAVNKRFKIDGNDVLDATTFYGTSIPNVSNFGAQVWVDVGPDGVTTPSSPPAAAKMRLIDNRIYTTKDDLDLELFADGTGNIVLNGTSQIKDVADPTDQQDAATKEYVDDVVETRAVIFSMDLTDGKPNSYIVTNILNNLAPPADYRDGVVARIMCTLMANSTTNLEINPLINQSTATFNTPTGTAPAVTNVAINTATVPAPPITVSRIIKEFQLVAGNWTFYQDIPLPP